MKVSDQYFVCSRESVHLAIMSEDGESDFRKIIHKHKRKRKLFRPVSFWDRVAISAECLQWHVNCHSSVPSWQGLLILWQIYVIWFLNKSLTFKGPAACSCGPCRLHYVSGTDTQRNDLQHLRFLYVGGIARKKCMTNKAHFTGGTRSEQWTPNELTGRRFLYFWKYVRDWLHSRSGLHTPLKMLLTDM